MRVAYVTSAPLISGAERNLQDILRVAPQTGIDPVVICPPHDPIQPWMAEHGIPVRTADLPVRDKWHAVRWFRGVSRLTSILAQESVDVIHVNHTFCYQAAGQAGRRLAIPRVCHLQNEVHQTDLAWTFSDGVECVVSLTRYLEDELRRSWPSTQIPDPKYVTLLSGMAVPPQKTPEELRQQQRDALARLNIARSGTVLGFIGMVKDIKGLVELLDALADVRRLRPDFNWQLIVAGADPDPQQAYIQRCRALVSEYHLTDRVHFIGFLDDTSHFYHAIDVAVIPSLIEPMGRISHEAAKFCKPSIAFASGGIPETIDEGSGSDIGRTGWMVDTGDVAALADMIVKVAPNAQQLQTVGRNARKRVEHIVDPVRHNQRLHDLYVELTGLHAACGQMPRHPDQTPAPV